MDVHWNAINGIAGLSALVAVVAFAESDTSPAARVKCYIAMIAICEFMITVWYYTSAESLMLQIFALLYYMFSASAAMLKLSTAIDQNCDFSTMYNYHRIHSIAFSYFLVAGVCSGDLKLFLILIIDFVLKVLTYIVIAVIQFFKIEK